MEFNINELRIIESWGFIADNETVFSDEENDLLKKLSVFLCENRNGKSE